MAISPLCLCAYWGPRRESTEQCAVRLYAMFSKLSAYAPMLATAWYEHTSSRKQALRMPAKLRSRDYFVALLDRSRNFNDRKKPMQEAGFVVSLWNGYENEREVAVTITCGSFSQWLLNSVVIDFSEDFIDSRSMVMLSHVLNAVAEAWQPDWGAVMSRKAMNARGFCAKQPFVDWMLYLSARVMPTAPDLPSPSAVSMLDSLGSIIVVQTEPPDLADPDHQRRIQQVNAELARSIRFL